MYCCFQYKAGFKDITAIDYSRGAIDLAEAVAKDEGCGRDIRFMVGLIQSFITWLTHRGRVTHICVSDLTIIGSDNGLSPGRRQAIIGTNAELLLNGPLGTNFSEILIEILTFSFKKMCLKVSSAKWRPFCLCLNVLMEQESVLGRLA